ncbi:MAG: hypothetical protein IKK21_03770 [Clostridia bacterium]|nr:hypothetical protein [Clostridia bacterium]
MKKLVSLCLAVLMLLTCLPASAAEMDLSHIRQNTEVFTMDVDVDNDVAFIESTLSASSRAYVHKYDSSTRYSTTHFDILVLEYLQTSAYPIFRLWITYCADDAYMNITSVSFYVEDQKYTFSGIADAERYLHDENGYVERLLIKFNEESLDFLAALERQAPDNYDDFDQYNIKMVLHGREDIEVELGKGFGLDFFAMVTAFINIGGLDYLEKCSGSTMKVTSVE